MATISLSQQRGHSVAAPVAVSAIPSVMQPLPHAPAPVCALQTAGGSSAFVSPTGSAFVPQPAPANQIPKKEVKILGIRYFERLAKSCGTED